MKHLFQISFLLLSNALLSAQANCLEYVVGSAGTELSYQSWRLSFTVGEPNVITLNAPSINRMLTQGIHQPSYPFCGFTGTDEPDAALRQAILFPNPTSGWVQLSFAAPPAGIIHFSVSNLLGQVVASGTTIENPDELLLDCNAYADGMYMITLEVPGNNVPATFRFVKSTP